MKSASALLTDDHLGNAYFTFLSGLAFDLGKKGVGAGVDVDTLFDNFIHKSEFIIS